MSTIGFIGLGSMGGRLSTAAGLGCARRDVAALFEVQARLDRESEEVRGDGYASRATG